MNTPDAYGNGYALRPGVTLTTNTSGKPERVLTTDELPQDDEEQP